MINIEPPTFTVSDIQQARTCNEVAAILFPQATCPAFLEYDSSGLNEPPKLQLVDLNDDFWALTLNHTVFVPQENQFRQYNLKFGIYEPITESALAGQLLTNLNLTAQHFPGSLKMESFLALKNRARLKGVVDRARDLLQVDELHFKDRQHLHLALMNGVLQIDTNKFHPSDPNIPVRVALPVKYDPAAKCELLTKAFLAHILSEPDIDLLQRYLSQVLEGINHSQTILVLTGDAGWGKSSLMKIVGSLVGWNRVGIIREHLFRDEFELSHYAGKQFLFHPDMPTSFLDRKEASCFKQLCGGDPLWADVKGDDGRMVLEGNFPVILACNGKPRIHIDQDSDAWMRRVVVLSFKKPEHEQHFGKMAELILKNEASGILNWLLEGRAKLAKDKLQLTQTPEQKARAAVLLMASESPAAFVRSCLVKQKDSELGVVDLYEAYQIWCQKHQLAPFSSKQFSRSAKAEIEISLGLKCRHDLAQNDGVVRGWKGLAMREAENVEIASNRSGG